MVLITLYKDITATSYSDLQKEVAGWAHLSNETDQHNVKKVCLALQKWAKGVIIPQTPAKLAQMAAKSNRPEGLDGVVLWVDTDFRMKGKCAVHKDKSK